MVAKLWKPGDKTNWRPSNGLAEDPDQRHPPRTPTPGPPPGQDYDTLTAQHGTPRRNLASGTKAADR